VLNERGSSLKVRDILAYLPTGEHCGLQTSEGVEFYEVCGKKMTLNASALHYVSMMEHFVEEYGARARQAESNEGVDWKAVSHAFRAAFQVRAILKEGDFTYPLRETDFLRAVKSGSLSFKNEVGPKLDAIMDEVEGLSKSSLLPEAVNTDFVDELLLHSINYSA